MKDSYLSVGKTTRNEIIIEKSRFICTICIVNGEEEARDFVLKIKDEFKDATHNCYAYISDSEGCQQRFSDDGEPQGTAGVPMLETLKNKNLFCTAAVVTRYFGGIKLGTGGLARAYSDSVLRGIDKAGIKNNILSFGVDCLVPYTFYSNILSLTEKNGGIMEKADFLGEGVKVFIVFPNEKKSSIVNNLNSIFSGKVPFNLLEVGYRAYENN